MSDELMTHTSSRKRDRSEDGKQAKPVAGHDLAASPEVNPVVAAINEVINGQEDANLRVGEIVDKEVQRQDGTQYGEDTIGTLARDPYLMCSAEHLRRCWHYFRLTVTYGAFLDKEYPALTSYVHRYQLSRLLQLDEPVAGEAIRAMAKEAMDKGTGGKPMPADKLAQAVTTHIRSITHPKTTSKGKGQGTPPPKPPTLAEAIVWLNEGLADAALGVPTITADMEYRHATDLQANIDRIGEIHVKILKYMIQRDAQSLAIPMARKRVIMLAEILGLKVVDPADTTEVAE